MPWMVATLACVLLAAAAAPVAGAEPDFSPPDRPDPADAAASPLDLRTVSLRQSGSVFAATLGPYLLRAL